MAIQKKQFLCEMRINQNYEDQADELLIFEPKKHCKYMFILEKDAKKMIYCKYVQKERKMIKDDTKRNTQNKTKLDFFSAEGYI